MPHLVQLLFVFSLISYATWVNAERYMVTQDSFGGYAAEPVDKETATEPSSAEHYSDENNPDAETPSLLQQGNMSPVQSEVGQDSPVASAKEKKELSVFERKYLEAEKRAQQEVLENLGRNKGSTPYDATVINEVEFVDGDALLGKPADTDSSSKTDSLPTENQRFFTTVDADGNLINTPYDPVLESEAWEKFRKKPPAFTEARIYRKNETAGPAAETDLPASADPVAMQILNFGNEQTETYFDAFSKECCAGLPRSKINDLEQGLSYSFDLDQDQLPYRFNEGDSRYLLLRLPELSENYPLLIRSFIRKYKMNNIEHGVFFPQLVTLDVDRKPLRIITGPLLKYVAETWTTYGYLEGFFEIERTEQSEEHYLLINTTRDVLRQSSVIEDGENAIQITHMATGLFEIKIPE